MKKTELTQRMPGNSIPEAAKITQNPYDYHKVLQFIEARGRLQYGNGFTIHETDRPVVKRIAAYFLKDVVVCDQEGLSLSKGILLTGPIGCGKSSIMDLMKLFRDSTKVLYVLKSCRDVSFEFNKEGFEVLYRYSRNSFYSNGNVIPREYVFDDLGAESNIKYYGNETNIMAEVLLSRYDLFVSKKLLTHITTNLSASEIEKHYGPRVRSRCRELFNLISFEAQSPDKRK